MKLSKYNIITGVGNHRLIYNTISSGVLLVEDEYINALDDMMRDNKFENENLVDVMKQGSMIINDEYDELEYLILKDRLNRFNTDYLGLTIAPTMNCNFSCTYCYEEGYRRHTLNLDAINGIIEFVKKYIPVIRNFDVIWYGGEPLLCMDIIEKMSKSFIELTKDKVNYTSSIITNGYFLNKAIASRLHELKVTSAQVTIDGPSEIHDQRRKLNDGHGTYNRIISNLKEVHDILQIKVRVNVDKSNISKLTGLLETLEMNGLKNKVSLYIAPVDNKFCNCTFAECFSMSEFSMKEVNFLEKALNKGFNLVSIPRRGPSVCGAVSVNSYVIDPKGDLYKCWETIGREDEKIGDVFKGLYAARNLSKWLLFDEFSSKRCRNCIALPVCLGGCPYHYMVRGIKKCKSIRYNNIKRLELFSRMRLGKDYNICK